MGVTTLSRVILSYFEIKGLKFKAIVTRRPLYWRAAVSRFHRIFNMVFSTRQLVDAKKVAAKPDKLKGRDYKT